MKIGPVDSQIALLIVKKEEINRSKIYIPVGNLAKRAKIFNGNIVATSYVNMINIGPKIAWVTTAPFWTRQQKSAYSTRYLNNFWTDLHKTFNISSHMYGDYKNGIRFAVAQGTLLQ